MFIKPEVGLLSEGRGRSGVAITLKPYLTRPHIRPKRTGCIVAARVGEEKTAGWYVAEGRLGARRLGGKSGATRHSRSHGPSRLPFDQNKRVEGSKNGFGPGDQSVKPGSSGETKMPYRCLGLMLRPGSVAMPRVGSVRLG